MRSDVFNFRCAEVRQILRLSHALHELGADALARRRSLLEGLCGLLPADAGVCVVSHHDGGAPTGVAPATTVSIVRYGMTDDDARTLAARYRAAPVAGWLRPRRDRGAGPAELGHPAVPSHPPRPPRRRLTTRSGAGGASSAGGSIAESLVDVPGMKMQACVALLRRRPGLRAFGPRERLVLDLVHCEMLWLYRPDLPALSPDGMPLSPRQRQTLQLLLAGNSEKEIAAQMGLSHNTVHHYVKALHRHFGVSSRSELLARWVRK